MNYENKNLYISYWILLITFLVALMIVVGGLTRLTDSGLSITKWDLVSGIFPPLTLNDWNELFSLYKKIPEFKLLNYSMTLDEFKVIFWWEYIHRLLGRIVGILYIIPLVYFTLKNKIEKKYIFSFYFIFFLICLQGFIGWYMVKSGLSERTDVSHYRLSLHLSLAFIIFTLLLWFYFKLLINNNLNYKKGDAYLKLPIIFLFLIFLQILIGAFVSGLDAGQIYNSWPLMNQNYFPDDSSLDDLFSLKSLENPSIVQFIHRNIAYLILLFFIFMYFKIYRNNKYDHLKKIFLLSSIALLLQITLGILTVIFKAQIIIASTHQIGSIFLISTSTILVFKSKKIN